MYYIIIMFKELYKNKKKILIFVLIIVFLIFVREGGMKKTIENFENSGNVIDTIVNGYDMTSQKFNDVFTQINGNEIKMNKNINTKGKITAGGDIKAGNGKVNIGANGTIYTRNLNVSNYIESVGGDNKASLSKTDIKKMKSLKNIAGFAINGDGSTFLLFEGYHKLHGGAKHDAWSNDKWDIIYLFKGWNIQIWKDGNKNSLMNNVNNKNEDVKKIDISNDRASEYEVKWIDY